ncbi:MAG: RecQ family ATP-dependent DNA helicase, partial [Saprospiraceae bacterium]
MGNLNPREALKLYWGYDHFRVGQEKIIQNTLELTDTLAILPTGAGKSLCYQLPSLCMEGCTIVISPLIALMQDQVQNLKNRNIFADLIYSGLKSKEIDRIIDNARHGELKLLYVSPERFTQEGFMDRLLHIKINFIAIDEAHCISQWGFDFRPSYLQIHKIREKIKCSFLALTATANPRVCADIIQYLNLKNCSTVSLSSARPNLSLSVRYEENKLNQLINVLPKFKNSGLLYARNRRVTVEIADQLIKSGFSIDSYHAGMEFEQRKKKLDSWMNNKTQYISCTTAFGMGIDKPDVDIVIHIELPSSIEEYYQEVGRAGRNGQKAYALCLYNERDVRRLIRIFDNSFPSLEEVQNTYKCLCVELGYAEGSIMENSIDFDLELFCLKYKLSSERTINSFKLLMQSGWINIQSAFFIPSKVRILADADTLDTYYNLNSDYKDVIVSLLRIYEGIFKVAVNIQENVLAFQSKIEVTRVKKILNYLHNEEVLQYIPQRVKPQIQILNERANSKEIILDEKWIASRKKVL